MLGARGAAGVRVFVVWEPVLTTDWVTPSPSLTGYVPAATHFWDPDRALSASLGGAARLESLAAAREVGFRMEDVLWDAALVYPPGVRWGAGAKLLVAPVFKYRDRLLAAW